jgi:hypothetical protein
VVSIPAESQKVIVNGAIAAHGYDVTFRRPAESIGTYSTATSQVETATDEVDQDEDARGVFLNYNLRDRVGDFVERGDRLFAMASTYNGAALAKVPQRGDQIIGEGDVQSVVEVQTIRGGSTTIAYLLLTRGP